METPYWCSLQRQKHGGRKVTNICYLVPLLKRNITTLERRHVKLNTTFSAGSSQAQLTKTKAKTHLLSWPAPQPSQAAAVTTHNVKALKFKWSLLQNKESCRAKSYPGFSSMKRQGVVLLSPLPMNEMLVHYRVTLSNKFAVTHLHTWVERGTVRVKCLAQKDNTMPPDRARIQATLSGDERTNHEATAPHKWHGMENLGINLY